MNRDDIIRMAREACDQAPREDWNSTAWVFGDESLEHFANLVAAAEREACAKLCINIEQSEPLSDRIGWEHGTVDCHAAIRARGEK